MENLSRGGIVFLFIFLTPLAQAANPLGVVINEIAWMGTGVSYNDEWIELYNTTNRPINLDGWVLKAADGTPEINLLGIIPKKSFYLLERTNDNTIPDIEADQIYAGALENDGEDLELYDNLGNLIDSANCDSGWFGGSNQTKQTMERKNPQVLGNTPENWQTSQDPEGTPKTKNSGSLPIIEPQSLKKPIPEPITYPSGIIINEILPSPTGLDAEEEWIEIFNQNGFEVNLSNWQISDIQSKTKSYSFPKGTVIGIKEFLVLSRPTSKITLNNDGDGLKLFQPDGKIIDEVTYGKAPTGQSYNLTESGWAWSATLTPGLVNVIPVSFKEALEEKTDTKPQKAEKSQTKKELAAIGEQVSKSSKSLFILLIAFSIATFSGIIILSLKRRIKER